MVRNLTYDLRFNYTQDNFEANTMTYHLYRVTFTHDELSFILLLMDNGKNEIYNFWKIELIACTLF